MKPGPTGVVSRSMVAWAALVALGLLIVPIGSPAVGAALSWQTWRELRTELPRLGVLATTTGVISLGVLGLTLPAGTLLAVAWFRFSLPGAGAVASCLAVGAFTPLVLYAGGWMAVFGPDGWFDSWTLGPLASTIFIHALAALPLVTLVIGIALTQVDGSIEDHARLRLSPLAVCARVSLPLCRSAVACAALLALVPVMTDMSVADLHRIRTLAEEVYTEFEMTLEARVTTLVSMMASLFLAVGLTLALGRTSFLAGRGGRAADRFPLRGAAWGLMAAALLLVMCYLVPLSGLILQLGLEVRDHPLPVSPAGVQPATPFLESAATSPAMAVPNPRAPARAREWSAGVAVEYVVREVRLDGASAVIHLLRSALAAALAVGAAGLLAWLWIWQPPRLQSLGLLLVIWSFTLPGPVLGMTLIDLWNRSGPFGLVGWLYDTPVVMIHGQMIRAFPLAFVILAGTSVHLDRRLVDLGRLEGLGPWRLLARIAGNCRSSVMVAWMFSLATILVEVPTMQLVAPPGTDPLGPRVFQLLHTGTANQQAAWCLLVLGMVGLTIAPALRWLRPTVR